MAWNIPNEGVPYYRAPAPEVAPPAKSQGIENLGSGLMALMAHTALAKEQARLEEEQNLRQADLAAKGLELKEKDMANDYELKKMLYGSYQTNADANLERSRKGIMNLIDTNTARQEYQDTINSFDAKALQAAGDLKLTDASFQAENPVEWAANKEEFKRRFGTAVVGATPALINKFDAQADQQKIPFIEGGNEVGSSYATDAKGNLKFTPGGLGGGKQIEVPVWQIAQRWKQADDQGKAAIASGLMAAGSGHIVQSFKKIGGKDVPETTQELNPKVKGYLKAGESADFTKGKSEVPEILTRKLNNRAIDYSGGGAGNPDYIDPNQEAADRLNTEQSIPVEPDVLPDTSSSKPAGFAPTKTDIVLQHARNALAANPGARDEIIRRLQGMSIDPGLLVG